MSIVNRDEVEHNLEEMLFGSSVSKPSDMAKGSVDEANGSEVK